MRLVTIAKREVTMRILFTAVLVALSIHLSAAQGVESTQEPVQPSPKAPDFRGAYWGMSKAQIRKSETAKFFTEMTDLGAVKGRDSLNYIGKVLDREVLIIYVFMNDKLVRTQYRFSAEHTNKFGYLDDYHVVSKALTEKYGKPDEDEMIWKDPLFKSDVHKYGTAVSVGHLVLFMTWYNADGTQISTRIDGDNYEIAHAVEYSSIEFGHLEKNAKDQKKEAEL